MIAVSVEREGGPHLSDTGHYRSREVQEGSWVLSCCEHWLASWSWSWTRRLQVWSADGAHGEVHEGKVVCEQRYFESEMGVAEVVCETDGSGSRQCCTKNSDNTIHEE
jgi:hypothetical protein